MAKCNFDDWIRELEECVIQGEFGFEEGEFTVYSEHWWPLFRRGLSPREAWQHALDAAAAQRREDDQRRAATAAPQ